MLKIKKNKFVLFYFYLLTVTTIFYLTSLHLNFSNAMTEWPINYQGGFTRRGLSGEVLFHISNLFDIGFKKSMLLVQCSTYVAFFCLIYLLIKELDSHYLIYISIFSAIFLLFPLAELEALGRKEIFVSILFLTVILIKNYSFNYRLILISFGSIIILLIHEIIFFYFLYFVIFLFIINKNNNFFNNLKIFFFFVLFFIITWMLVKNTYTTEMMNEMCKSLKENLDVVCGLNAYYTPTSISNYIGEVKWDILHYFRNFFIFICGYGPLLILSLFTKFNKKKVNPLIVKVSVFYLVLILIIPTLLIFFVAVDTGRFFHLSYSMAFIFFFGLKFNDLIEFNDQNLLIFEKKIFPKSKTLMGFIIFLMCFSWNPKAVYHEDLGSIPIYRIYERIDIYYNTLKW